MPRAASATSRRSCPTSPATRCRPRASPRSASADRKLPLVKRQPAARRLRRQRRQFHRHRAQLLRSRRRGRHADPEGADHLQQGADLHLRAERRHHDPEGLEQARLGGRARHRDRPARALPVEEQGAGRGRRLLPGNDVSERVFQIERARPMDQGQGLRDLRPARALARHQGRDQGPAAARHVARRQRREAPARQHQDHDLRLPHSSGVARSTS